jgi:hypothetical protein
MNAAILLMLTYVVLAIVLQALGFGVSKLVDYINPAWSMMTFLVLFFCAFAAAWPIAVRITEPKSVEDALENDLKILRHNGTIADFTVTHRKDGAYVRVSPGPDSPPDLRRVLALALHDLVSEERINIAT